MAKVPYPRGTNGSVGRYGKGQSILVESFGEKTEAGEIKSKIARKGKTDYKLVNNLSKTAEKKAGFY